MPTRRQRRQTTDDKTGQRDPRLRTRTEHLTKLERHRARLVTLLEQVDRAIDHQTQAQLTD